MEEFIETLTQQGFFAEWARLVKGGANPSSLACVTLEKMRSEDNSTRSSHTLLSSFIDCRPWADFLKTVRPSLTAEQVAAFELPEAEIFYLQYRKMVLTAVSQYYQELLTVKVPTLLDPVAGLDPIQEVEEKLVVFIRTQVREEIRAQMVVLAADVKKGVAEQMRKQLGEDWKGDSQDEPEVE